MTVTTHRGAFTVSRPLDVYLLVARHKVLRWIGFALVLSCASCGGAPPIVAPSALGASALSVLHASSSNTANVRVNTSGSQLMLFFSPEWDVRDVRMSWFRRVMNTWVHVGDSTKSATAATGLQVADFSKSFPAGEYRGDLTRIDTPTNQTVTITFDFDGATDRAGAGIGDVPTPPPGPNPPSPPGPPRPPSGDCKVDLPESARPMCPPGHGGTPPGQESRR